MVDWKLRASPRTWEDWLGITLGIAIVLAPWIMREIAIQAAVVNAAVAGCAVILLAELDLVSFRRWAEAGLLACGCWVAIRRSSSRIRAWHCVAGL